MSIFQYFLYLIIAIGIIVILLIVFPIVVNGQQATKTEVVTPTPVPTPTPTSPNPNLQYLPQKAYVQSYAPEIGIPSPNVPLTAVPQVIPVQPQQQSSVDTNSIMTIINTIMAAGGGLLAKVGLDKARKVEGDNKETNAAVLTGMNVDEQLAKKLFEFMGAEKANAINDSPAIKLETLNKDKEDFANKASKA